MEAKARDKQNAQRWAISSLPHKALAAGLWIGAFGIFLQAATGAQGYPKAPPGIPILAVVGLVVYFTSRWAWTAVGVFATPGTAYRHWPIVMPAQA